MKFKTLNSKWKEILYAASGFGPNLLMVLMGGYFTDAINPAALNINGESLQAIGTACYIMPLVFPILWAIAKIFDGLIDIPMAAITDNLKSRWGRRRPPIAVCFIPMVVSYALCWMPIFGPAESAQLGNTIWIVAWAFVFFATYTMCLIAFYGSLSTVCYSDDQRLRVSSFKSFFDTISYCFVYALVPLLLGVFKMHIDKFVMCLLPLMMTMIIPLFMIKEGEKWEKKAIEQGYDIKPLAEEPNVGIGESIKLTMTNKPFLIWCIVNCCSFFGLQMFLVAMNAMIVGGMGLSSVQMAILNTCAFAPVPIMLYLFTKLKAKKGIRFAYQTCLISFAVAIFSFFIGSCFVMGDNTTAKIIVGSVGGVMGSWAIGSFFMMPYMIPAQISSVEEKLTGKNHSAMFFAAQAFTTSVIGAVASSLVYENIKNLFIAKGAKGVVFAKATETLSAAQVAAEKFGITFDAALKGSDLTFKVFNLGTLLVPFFVAVFCLLGFIIAFKMPKNYSPKEVSDALGLQKEYEEHKDLFPQEDNQEIKDESLIVNIALWVLSGSIFGILWQLFLMRQTNVFAEKRIKFINWIISLLCFPYHAVIAFRINQEIGKKAQKLGVSVKNLGVLHIILCVLGLGLASNIILQVQMNKLAKATVNE